MFVCVIAYYKPDPEGEHPFPTLKECFDKLDPELGFNIEIKYCMKLKVMTETNHERKNWDGVHFFLVLRIALNLWLFIRVCLLICF